MASFLPSVIPIVAPPPILIHQIHFPHSPSPIPSMGLPSAGLSMGGVIMPSTNAPRHDICDITPILSSLMGVLIYGCPGIEEIESFNKLYKQKLDEIIEGGEIPLDLAVEVSSPGAERLLKVPEDLDRFKDMVMRVQYLVEADDLVPKQIQHNDGIFLLESVDIQAEQCVWKLADVKENRAEAGKGRPLNRKQRDWRLQTSFKAVKKATLYLE
ncbi:hypothetical protein GUJ93_ZPchr0016g2574 [Zizania palustris]|uniref:DUF7912 domain-containing protein n=1 Tax=Zizania palustris TaxID=103762 RepID=A0A8J5TM25_ZIZPA|nr:hypothetical protein GUJ93_ZPchr0016g2574 [Zizania palustris]